MNQGVIMNKSYYQLYFCFANQIFLSNKNITFNMIIYLSWLLFILFIKHPTITYRLSLLLFFFYCSSNDQTITQWLSLLLLLFLFFIFVLFLTRQYDYIDFILSLIALFHASHRSSYIFMRVLF